MKYFIVLLLSFGFLFSTNANGQEEAKKVVIIKKVKGADGKTTTERQEASGKDADELIKKMKEDGTLEGIDIDVEIENAKNNSATKKSVKKEVSIEKSIKDGKEETSYTITTASDDEMKVIHWSGEGEMPAEMADILKDEEIEIISKEGKKEYKIMTDENGEKNVLFWNGEGEMPAEMSEILKTVDIKTVKNKDGDHMTITVEMDDDEQSNKMHQSHNVEKTIKIERKSENKVTLGVMIEDDSRGVLVSSVVDGSVAQKAGLVAGDTILKINDTYVFNVEMLLDALSKFDNGDSVKVTYLRDGKEKKATASF